MVQLEAGILNIFKVFNEHLTIKLNSNCLATSLSIRTDKQNGLTSSSANYILECT